MDEDDEMHDDMDEQSLFEEELERLAARVDRHDAHWARISPQLLRIPAPQWRRAGEEVEAGAAPAVVSMSHDQATLLTVDGFTVRVIHPAYGWRRTSSCDCGRRSCQHVATAFRALTEHRQRSLWRTAAPPPVVRARRAAPVRRSAPTVTAVVLSVIDRPGSPDHGQVGVRPSRRTAKGTWHKNMTWERSRPGWQSLPAAQRDALRLLDSQRRGGSRELLLEHTGPEIWSLLDGLRAAGMELAVEEPLALLAGEARVTTEVIRRPDGLVVRSCPSCPGRSEEQAASASRLVGAPAHAVLMEDGDGRPAMIRLASDISPAALDLAQLGELWVPKADAEEFSRMLLPRLQDSATVILREDAAGEEAALPEPLRLLARLRPRGLDGARLSWHWCYGEPGGQGALEVDLPPSLGDGRRMEAELALGEALAGDIDGLAEWLSPQPRELDLVEACTFSITVRHALEDDPRALVLLEGEAQDFRAASEVAVDWELHQAEERDWLELDGTVTVDGQDLPLGALIRALRAQQPFLIGPTGCYVDLSTPAMQEMRELLDQAASLPDQERVRIHRHDLDMWEALQELSALETQAETWRSLLAGIIPSDRSEEPLDPAVRADLRAYQMQGYRWLSARWDVGLGGVLADDMGLGKTLQLLAAIRRRRRVDGRPVLVSAPRSVLGTWAEQSARFVPDLRVQVIDQRLGEGGLRDLPEADLYITSHTLTRLDEEHYQDREWAAVVVDEAQAAKNPLSRLHRALRSLHREVTWVVTGTPVENSLQDLWALLALAAPGLLPPLREFTAQWRRPIEKEGDTERLASLRRRIRPLMLRRTKDLVARDLPEKSSDVLSIGLRPAEARAYSRLLNRERQRVLGLLDDPDRNRVEILASLMRLRISATDPGTLESPSPKAAELVQRLREVREAGHRALVFSQFTSHLRVLRDILEQDGISTSYLDGGTARREQVIEDFRAGSQSAFLISLKAGGSGITLTEADYVFLMDPWWNPAVEEQAVDRTHRIGQRNPVSVYRFVSAETIEEKVIALQEEKRSLAASVLDLDAAAGGSLDSAQIRDLLAG